MDAINIQDNPKVTPYSKITVVYSIVLITFSIFVCTLLYIRQLNLCFCFKLKGNGNEN